MSVVRAASDSGSGGWAVSRSTAHASGFAGLITTQSTSRTAPLSGGSASTTTRAPASVHLRQYGSRPSRYCSVCERPLPSSANSWRA